MSGYFWQCFVEVFFLRAFCIGNLASLWTTFTLGRTLQCHSMDWHSLMNSVRKCLQILLNKIAFQLVHYSWVFLRRPCPSCLVEDPNSLEVASHMRKIRDWVLSLVAASECRLVSSLHRWASIVHTPHIVASCRCCGHAGHSEKRKTLSCLDFLLRDSLCSSVVSVLNTSENGL